MAKVHEIVVVLVVVLAVVLAVAGRAGRRCASLLEGQTLLVNR